MRLFGDEDGACVAVLDEATRDVLRALARDTATLLGGTLTEWASDAEPDMIGWSSDQVEIPEDPALARLLPSAREEDDDLAREFRRLTDHDLRAAKVSQLQLVHDSFGDDDHVRVEFSEALDFSGGINDIRLVLADRLGITSPEQAELIQELAWRDPTGAEEASDDGDEADPGGDGDMKSLQAGARMYAMLAGLQETIMDVLLAQEDDGEPPARTGG